MASNRLALLTLAVLVGCGGERGSSEAANDLSRDLQRVPADSSATLGDHASSSGATVAAEAAPLPAPQPKPKATPKPKAKPAPAPAPTPVVRALATGATLSTTVDREISSKTDKAGQTVTASVAADVRDASGQVVIPAGSKVTLTITEIHESENKGDKTGKLTLTPSSVEIAGTSYSLEASAVAVDRTLRDRKTNAGDVAKVGVGTAAGAVVGRVIGGNTKGAVIGGLIGGAIGTQRAVETQDRDVVVPAGSRVELTLNGTFTR
ncbi:MAG: glycine zipper 2TM domain-containing protein [Gemmatimonadales bacterium]